MIHFQTDFENYNWNIEVYIILRNPDIECILYKLKRLNCPEDILEKAVSRLTEYENSGFTYTNPSFHKSIIVINKPYSMKEFIDTYNHEKNHVEIHICKEFNIDPTSEQAAYLSGQLSKKLFESHLRNFAD